MEWQTKIEIVPPGFQLDYGSGMFMLGSCFTENIGQKLSYYKFPVDINPCGIVYNPLSVAQVLSFLLQEKIFDANDLIENNGLWVSPFHHGSFSSPDKEVCLRGMNERLRRASAFLRKANVLILTWGTAWAYRDRETGSVVANCHKFPADRFDRFCLTQEEIVNTYRILISQLRQLNPDLKLLFTVSPIRHWKDGAHGNQLSKAVLLLAQEQLRQETEGIYYFPAYELFMDELRDYRFYAEDMLHPSDAAVEYIWEKFRETYLSPSVQPLMKRIEKVNKILRHRPLHEEDPDWQLLQKRALEDLEEIYREIADWNQ